MADALITELGVPVACWIVVWGRHFVLFFIFRKGNDEKERTLFVFNRPSPQVKHYHIKQNAKFEFYLSEKHCCATIAELVNYHRLVPLLIAGAFVL